MNRLTSGETRVNTRALFSSGKDDWETPDELYHDYNQRFNFVLDAAADGNNHKCDVWFGPDSPVNVVDALTADWSDYLKKGNVWLNPPYSRGLQKRFVEKVVNERSKQPVHTHGWGHVVCLLPARTDTKLFHEIIKPYASSIEFLKGRLKFKGGKSCAPFPSMIVVF